MNQNLVITQDQIEEFQSTGARFMREVLGLDYEKVFVTDISDLSDFCFSGMSEPLDKAKSMKELTAIWDAWAIARVQKLYGITLTSTVVNLVWLFNKIESPKKALLH